MAREIVKEISKSGKNKIINGDMRIDQRYAGGNPTIVDGIYCMDRWKGFHAGTSSVTMARVTSSVPSGFSHAMKLTVGIADASIAASDAMGIVQLIEGSNCLDLDFGLATAKDITISFWVRSSKIGIYTGSIANSAFNRSKTFEYTVLVANTWEKKYVTLTGDTAGTWLTTTSIGLRAYFMVMSGTNYQTPAGTWAAGAYVATSNQVNWTDTIGASFYITGVQLEVGSVPTEFEHISMTQTIQRCQRYYQKSWNIDTATGTITTIGQLEGRGNATNAGAGYVWLIGRFATAMRAIPFVNPVSPTTAAGTALRDIDAAVDVQATTSGVGELGFNITNNVAMGGVSRRVSVHFTADAEL